MNYKSIHDKLIDRAKNRDILINEYYENHHILPRCMGGSDDKINLVKLTGREHYIVHWLLAKIYPDNEKLICAAFYMSCNRWGRRYNSKTFSYVRKKHIKVISERQKLRIGKLNSFFGKQHKQEFKDKLSKERRGTWTQGSNNSMFNKSIYDIWLEKYGKEGADIRMEEYKETMKNACLGEKNGFYGKKHNDNTRKKIAEKRKAKYILIDPNNIEYIRYGIEGIAKEFNLHARTLVRFIDKGIIPAPVHKNKSKEHYNTTGWQIKKYE